MTPTRRIDRLRRGFALARRSFATKLVVLIAVFVAVPIVVYDALREAELRQQALLLQSMQDRGWLLGETLRPLLERFDPRSASQLGPQLSRLSGRSSNTKVLFRPSDATGTDSFYYVASTPTLPTEYLASERSELLNTGIFGKVFDSCESFAYPAFRYRNPSGQEEILTSVTPVLTKAGCWVIVTSIAASGVLASALGQPFWKSPQARLAAAIYLVMVIFVIWLFTDIWGSLRRFARLAREIRMHGARNDSFAEKAVVPELAPVAREFDGLVSALDGSARMIRFAAEENAHAFKNPIGAIAQAVEPLRRYLPNDDPQARRTLSVIEQSVDRLDALVSAARRMDEAAAELLDPPRHRMDLSDLLRRIADDYGEMLAEAGCRLVVPAMPAVFVLGNEDLLETVIENLLDNAASFSPHGGEIRLSLDRGASSAILKVEDQGPGVDPEHLDRIFDRYFSFRNRTDRNAAVAASAMQGSHFGIGLWIVRRNVEALGGAVTAENRTPRGLRVSIALPRL